jgi:hypothetical protein
MELTVLCTLYSHNNSRVAKSMNANHRVPAVFHVWVPRYYYRDSGRHSLILSFNVGNKNLIKIWQRKIY